MVETSALEATEIARRVAAGELSAASVVESSLERLKATEPLIGAFLRVCEERAYERAAEIDRRVRRGERVGPLAGVPTAVKDNISVAGLELSCGSRILEGYVAPYSATAIERLESADAVIVGQTNMDEFAMGSSCENSAFAPTRNPWRRDRVPGGSSGGSAAAVAAGTVPLALGSDTGGSIRQPAALCGIVGLKPTYGRVSRYGLVAFASSLDQIGPLTASVGDAAVALGVLAGHDPSDSTSVEQPVDDYLASLEHGIEGCRVGVLREVEVQQLGPDVLAAWETSLARLESLGAKLVEISVPTLRAAIAIYYVLANCEASANLARFDGVRYGRRAQGRGLLETYTQSRSQGFGREVKRRIMLGTLALSSGYYEAYYGRAVGVLAGLRSELRDAFEKVDLLATPTSPTAAFPLGERTEDPLAMYLSDTFTTPASLVGLPGLALPAGYDADGLPLSLQLVARPFEERLLLQAGRAFERESGGTSRPTLPAAAHDDR